MKLTNEIFSNSRDYLFGWKTVATKHIYSNNYIELYEDVMEINGKEKIYTRCRRRDYSTIVPFVSSDEILVIKSYRHFVNSIQIEAPSGYIDDDEMPETAAIRELREETGYRPGRVVNIGTYTLDYTMFQQVGNLFVAYDLVKEGDQELGLMELIEPTIMTVSEIRKLLQEGKILNSSSIVAFYRAIDFNQKQKLQEQSSTTL
jgi:ADP-ribose pyrophosphatase